MFEIGPALTGYFGAALLSGCYLAVSGFFSVMTKSQVISCVLAVIGCVIFIVIGNPSATQFMPEFMVRFCEALSFSTQFDVMQRGLIEIGNLLFMVVMIGGFLFASVVMLNDRKAV